MESRTSAPAIKQEDVHTRHSACVTCVSSCHVIICVCSMYIVFFSSVEGRVLYFASDFNAAFCHLVLVVFICFHSPLSWGKKATVVHSRNHGLCCSNMSSGEKHHVVYKSKKSRAELKYWNPKVCFS